MVDSDADDIEIFVDCLNGDDENPGTKGLPVKTLERAFTIVPETWKGKCEIIGQSDVPILPLVGDLVDQVKWRHAIARNRRLKW